MNIVVIGGGFVGQLVQYAVPGARVLDVRKEPPADHMETRIGPQYLWEPIPGCESTSFRVLTQVDGLPPTPESILAYKKKIGKEDDGGNWGLQFQPESIGWISRLPKPRIEYNKTVRMVDLMGNCLGMADWTTINYDLLVSTIPMPEFLGLMIVGPSYNAPFKFDPIYMSQLNVTTHLPGSPFMLLNYLSDPDDPCYRRTTTHEALFSEYLTKPATVPIRKISPGKIHPHPENQTILANLGTYDCFCFGRFATWRPDELAHETYRDILDWKARLGI